MVKTARELHPHSHGFGRSLWQLLARALVHEVLPAKSSYTFVSACGMAFDLDEVHDAPFPVTCLWCVAGRYLA